MKRGSFRSLTVLFCLSGSLLFSQGDPDAKMSSGSVAASERQTKKLQREIRSLANHDWAGEYYYGDGLGVNVRLLLAPRNGFVFTWHGCLGLYDLNYGDVSFTEGTVKLLFRFPNKSEGFEGIAPEFRPVMWGQRHYLIPVDGMIAFTNAINAGMEPNTLFGGKSSEFLLRRGDELKPAEGMPNIPDEYLSYILKAPLEARISSIIESRVEKTHRITRVTLNLGSADGLKKGMTLFVKHPSNLYCEAEITDVSEHWASAVIERESSEPAPSVGWLFSTKL